MSGSDDAKAVKELLEMLFHPREDVRANAAQIVSGLAADTAGKEVLYAAGIASKLARLLGDEPSVARHAADTLVNLSDEGRFLHQMLDIKVVRMVMESIRSPRCAHRRAAVMLLSNLCLTPEGCIQLLQRDEDDGRLMGLYLRQLLHWMLRGPPKAAGGSGGSASGQAAAAAAASDGDSMEHAGLVLQNVTTLSDARRLLLDRERRIVPDLLKQLRSPSVIRRRGASGTLKNLCFEQEHLEALAEPSLGFIEAATRPLAGPEPRSPEERADMPAAWLEMGSAKQREPDPVTRRNLLEILAMLASIRSAREQMRAMRVYEIARDLHVWLEGHCASETREPGEARGARQAQEAAYLEARGVGEQGAGTGAVGGGRKAGGGAAAEAVAGEGGAGGKTASSGAGSGGEATGSEKAASTAATAPRGPLSGGPGGFYGGVPPTPEGEEEEQEENPLSADDVRSVVAVGKLADFLHRDEEGPPAIAGAAGAAGGDGGAGGSGEGGAGASTDAAAGSAGSAADPSAASSGLTAHREAALTELDPFSSPHAAEAAALLVRGGIGGGASGAGGGLAGAAVDLAGMGDMD